MRRRFVLWIMMGVMIGLLWIGPAVSAEYYVVKSRSGVVFITDHEPQSGATLLKGPFESPEAAQDALTDEEKEALGTPGKDQGQCQGRGQGKGQGRGRSR